MIIASLLCILISLPYITTLSCYRCIAEQYASPRPTIYYNTDAVTVNTSCLRTGADCDADSGDTVKCVTLTIDAGYEDDALSMKIYDCVVEDDDPCEIYGYEQGQGCSNDTCEKENCNSPPISACPTCEVEFSEFCAAAQCPEQPCTDDTGLCFTRFDPASCTVSRGCLEPEQTCSGEFCETTSNTGDNSNAVESKKVGLCSEECDSISCPSCTVKLNTGQNLTTVDLLGCEERETCEDGVKKCTVTVHKNCSSVQVGCGTPADNNANQSETITTEDTLQIIKGKLSDSDICNGSIVDKCCCFILLLATLIVANVW